MLDLALEDARPLVRPEHPLRLEARVGERSVADDRQLPFQCQFNAPFRQM